MLAWDELEDLSGDVALEAAHDELRLLAFFGPSLDVGLGVGAGRHAAHDNGPQGAVGLSVAAAVQAVVAIGLAAAGRDRSDTAEPGEAGFVVQPLGVVTDGDQQRRGGVRTDAERLEQVGGDL